MVNLTRNIRLKIHGMVVVIVCVYVCDVFIGVYSRTSEL